MPYILKPDPAPKPSYCTFVTIYRVFQNCRVVYQTRIPRRLWKGARRAKSWFGKHSNNPDPVCAGLFDSTAVHDFVSSQQLSKCQRNHHRYHSSPLNAGHNEIRIVADGVTGRAGIRIGFPKIPAKTRRSDKPRADGR